MVGSKGAMRGSQGAAEGQPSGAWSPDSGRLGEKVAEKNANNILFAERARTAGEIGERPDSRSLWNFKSLWGDLGLCPRAETKSYRKF